MKKKKNNSKLCTNKIKIIILLLILICIIAIILLLRFKSKKAEAIVKPESREEVIEEYVEDKVIPQNISVFVSNYKGNVSRDTFYKKLYSISRYLPELVADLKENSNIEEYYKDNSEKIKKNIGIDDEQNFKTFAEYLLQKDISKSDFEYCVYVKNSLYTGNVYSEFLMKFKYENFDEINLSVKLLNSDSPRRQLLVLSVPPAN